MVVNPRGHSHRSGSLKQANKKHKTKHKTKGELDRKTNGKIEKIKPARTGPAATHLSRLDRKNKARMLRDAKKDAFAQRRRLMAGPNGLSQIVGFVPLDPCLDARSVMRDLIASSFREIDLPVPQSVHECTASSTTFYSPKLKQPFTYVGVDMDLMDILDLATIADSLVLLVPSTRALGEDAELIISALKGFGLPNVSIAAPDTGSIPQKHRIDVKRTLAKYMNFHFPTEDKVYTLETDSDKSLFFRHISSLFYSDLHWRTQHGYVVTQNVDFFPANGDGSPNSPQEPLGMMAIDGFVRGCSVSANELVRIHNLGEFEVDRIVRIAANRQEDATISVPEQAVKDDLVAYVEDAEDWEAALALAGPSQHELDFEQRLKALRDKNLKRILKVPEGTSDYQAAWYAIVPEILDDSDSNPDDDDSDDNSDSMMGDDTQSGYAARSGTAWNGSACSGTAWSGEADEMDDGISHSNLDASGERTQVYEEENALEAYDRENFSLQDELQQLYQARAQRQAELENDLAYPDEIDVPLDTTARSRFKKYRGMANFRTGAWDKKESLPVEYSRIFEFENLARTHNNVLKQKRGSETAVAAGEYVRVYLKNVSLSAAQRVRNAKIPPACIFLLKHENKRSVLNFAIRRHPSFPLDTPVKSKDSLLFVTPTNRFVSSTVFSEHTSSDRHKLLRFLPEDPVTVIATTYAPVIYAPSPVLVFELTPKPRLLALGSLESVNPDRIILKRYILSGQPFKIHQRTITVRFMFFHIEDIEWFKPVQLYTKSGRRGHIKESLGTHGHMKVALNGPIKSNDYVYMNLYKRTYPRWNYQIYDAYKQYASSNASPANLSVHTQSDQTIDDFLLDTRATAVTTVTSMPASVSFNL